MSADGAGNLVVEQVSSYYPFGMSHVGLPNSSSNKYLYNGKEKQDEALSGVAFDWYDYGARFYDAQIGRWHTLDALANDEMQIDKSPYSYAWNSPVNLTDPDGNCPWCIGAIIGGLVEYASQVAQNYAEGNENIFTENINGTKIFYATVEGGLTSGTSSILKAGVNTTAKIILKETADMTIDAAGSAAQQYAEKGEVSGKQVFADVVVGKATDVMPIKNLKETKTMERQLDRANRVNDGRANRVEAVKDLKSKLKTANEINYGNSQLRKEVVEVFGGEAVGETLIGSTSSTSLIPPNNNMAPASSTYNANLKPLHIKPIK